MSRYCGNDVSLEQSSVCVLDQCHGQGQLYAASTHAPQKAPRRTPEPQMFGVGRLWQIDDGLPLPMGFQMNALALTHRLARAEDLNDLRSLMAASIEELQKPFLTAEQIASSWTIMGLDTQLIDDGTYFIVQIDGQIAGCGGWSRRATLYGGDQSPGRDAALLNPKTDAARVRAMYTHPAFKRRGVGRLIIGLCEDAARREGFIRAELMSTLAGEPLYRAVGYKVIEELADDRGGVPVPLVRMAKDL